MNFVKKALHQILSKQNEYCCLCFESVKGNGVNIYDEVVLKTPKSENHIKLSEILISLLGEEVSSHQSILVRT